MQSFISLSPGEATLATLLTVIIAIFGITSIWKYLFHAPRDTFKTTELPRKNTRKYPLKVV